MTKEWSEVAELLRLNKTRSSKEYIMRVLVHSFLILKSNLESKDIELENMAQLVRDRGKRAFHFDKDTKRKNRHFSKEIAQTKTQNSTVETYLQSNIKTDAIVF